MEIYPASEQKVVINDELQKAVSRDPGEASFNLNVRLPNGLGKKDIDIHLSAELLAEAAVEELRERYPGASEAMCEALRAGVKYNAVARAGKRLNQSTDVKIDKKAFAKSKAIAEAGSLSAPIAMEHITAVAEPIFEANKNATANSASNVNALSRQALTMKIEEGLRKEIMIDEFRLEIADSF